MEHSTAIKSLLKTYGNCLYGHIISSIGPLNISETTLVQSQCLAVLSGCEAYNLNYHDGEYRLEIYCSDENTLFMHHSLLEVFAQAAMFIINGYYKEEDED
jgi:hypothetical protein